MNTKILAVIKREYLTRVKTKGFIIGTLLFPLILIFLFGGIFIFGRFFQPSTKHYTVIDKTDKIFDELVIMLPDKLKNGELEFSFNEIKTIETDHDEIVKELQNKIMNKQLDGYLVIPEDILESRVVKYSARNVSDYEELEKLQWAISRVIGNLRLQNKGVSPEEIRNEMRLGRISLESTQVTKKGEISKDGTSNFLLTYLLSYMLMLFTMIYGQIVTRSVIEEKSQRITETIISSIKPVELMVGKIFGICLLGITQLLVIGGFIFALANYGESMFLTAGIEAPKLLNIVRTLHFTPVVFGFFLLFFFMGYTLYATLFAAIGSIVNTEDEGQQFLFPIIILNILSFFIMFSVARNPDTSAAFWSSLIPFFTPVVMFARIAVSDPVLPSGAIISIFTLAFFIYFIIKLVSKIYRVGILMYGKKPSIKEALKWLRY
ncbi:ABC transporter permease [Candidatus Cloacimonadota bacterium]